jgi:hypothetical protein
MRSKYHSKELTVLTRKYFMVKKTLINTHFKNRIIVVSSYNLVATLTF